MAPQNGKKSAKQQTTNVLKRKPFHRLSARQQEKVSKKQAKTATLKEQPTDVIQARRRDRKARFKAKRKPCGPLTAEEAFDQDIWATYRLVQAECQPSKVDLLAAAAEPDKQVEIKAIHTAYNQVLNRVVRSGEFTSQDRNEHRSLIVRLQRLQIHLYIDEKALAIPNTSSPGRENREPLSDDDMLFDLESELPNAGAPANDVEISSTISSSLESEEDEAPSNQRRTPPYRRDTNTPIEISSRISSPSESEEDEAPSNTFSLGRDAEVWRRQVMALRSPSLASLSDDHDDEVRVQIQNEIRAQRRETTLITTMSGTSLEASTLQITTPSTAALRMKETRVMAKVKETRVMANMVRAA
jgi:hypothetical protein